MIKNDAASIFFNLHSSLASAKKGLETRSLCNLRAKDPLHSGSQPIVKPHVSSETWGLPYRIQCKSNGTKRTQKWLPEQGSHCLHVLNGGGEEGLLAHVGVAAHAGIAKAVELFGVREGAFNRLFSPSVDILSRRSFCEGVCLIQIVLPYMPRYHLSFTACSETLRLLWAGLTGFGVAAVLSVSIAACRGVLEQAALRADIAVDRWIISEPKFAICTMRVCVPSIA